MMKAPILSAIIVLLSFYIWGNSPLVAQEPQASKSRTFATTQWYSIVLKNARPSLLAWLIDPVQNRKPEFLPPSEDESALRSAIWPFHPATETQEKVIFERREKLLLDLPPGVEAVVPADPQKTLLVLANEGGLGKLQKIIDTLDRPLRQVEIRAEFVQTTLENILSLGIPLDEENLGRVESFISNQFLLRDSYEPVLRRLVEQKRVTILATAHVLTQPFQVSVIPVLNNDDTVSLQLASTWTTEFIREPTTETSKPVSKPQRMRASPIYTNIRAAQTIAFRDLTILSARPRFFEKRAANSPEVFVLLTVRIVREAIKIPG